MKILDVAVIGAGPYGLSLGAFLTRAGVSHCVFGPPMAFWRDNMPPGMKLKSDGRSSDLPSPGGGFRFRQFQTEHAGVFNPIQPIPVETFHAYGMAFHDRLAPQADQRLVRLVSREAERFCVTLADGERIAARFVVLAVGVRPFAWMPPAYAALPAHRVSHSVVYGAVDALAGKRVAVIGSGASAIDTAAALLDAGAETTILTRRETIAFHHPPGPRPLRQRIRRPDTGIGGGWDLWAYANFPRLFHTLPRTARLGIVERTLGPAPGWFMRERIEGKLPILTGMTTDRVADGAGGVRIDLRARDGETCRLEVDHVITATGFRPDLSRLDILDPALAAAAGTAGAAPALSRDFETSVSGLYMIGPVAAASFGPVMRFVFGAGQTTPALARHLIARARREATEQRQSPSYSASGRGARHI